MSKEVVTTDYQSQSQQQREPNIVVSGHDAKNNFFYSGFGQENPDSTEVYKVLVPKDKEKDLMVGIGVPREWHRVVVPEFIRKSGIKIETLATNALRSIRYLINQEKEL
jgi:hypothetical protein